MKKNRPHKTFLIPKAEYLLLQELLSEPARGFPGIVGSPVVLMDEEEFQERTRAHRLSLRNPDRREPPVTATEAEATHYLVTGRFDPDTLDEVANAVKLRARAQQRGKAMTGKQSQDLRAALKELPGTRRAGNKAIVHTYKESN